jgi:hypothetical protein
MSSSFLLGLSIVTSLLADGHPAHNAFVHG